MFLWLHEWPHAWTTHPHKWPPPHTHIYSKYLRLISLGCIFFSVLSLAPVTQPVGWLVEGLSVTCSLAGDASGRDYMPVCGVCIGSVSLCRTVCELMSAINKDLWFCGSSSWDYLHQVKWNKRDRATSSSGLNCLVVFRSFCWLQGELSITSSVCGGLKWSLLSAQMLQAKPQTLEGSWWSQAR